MPLTETSPTTTTTTTSAAPPAASDENWRQAGAAWDHAATDWAFLFEPYARDAIETVFARTGVGPGVDLLDVACGSGLAAGRAERLGARVAGIDAAAGLVAIAHRRAPASDLRAGTMFALPWADASFDVVTSFNGIWGGCEGAVGEIGRVLRPGGLVGLTFWGRPDHLDLRDYFLALASTRQDVSEEMIDLAAIGQPGVAESMLEAAGLELIDRGTSTARLELADDATAWRALRSPGIALPPLQEVGEDELRARVLAAIAPYRAADGSYLLANELTYVLARRDA